MSCATRLLIGSHVCGGAAVIAAVVLVAVSAAAATTSTIVLAATAPPALPYSKHVPRCLRLDQGYF